MKQPDSPCEILVQSAEEGRDSTARPQHRHRGPFCLARLRLNLHQLCDHSFLSGLGDPDPNDSKIGGLEV